MGRGKTNKTGEPAPKRIKNKEKYKPKNPEKAAAKKALSKARKARRAAITAGLPVPEIVPRKKEREEAKAEDGSDSEEDERDAEDGSDEHPESGDEAEAVHEDGSAHDRQSSDGADEVVPPSVVEQSKSKKPKGLTAKNAPLPDELEIDTNLPTPLSKAQLRQAKKKSSTSDATTSASVDKERKEPEKPKKLKKQNSVWVGNLNYRTTSLALRQFFEQGLKELAETNEIVKEALQGGKRKLERRDEKRAERAKAAEERGEEVKGKKKHLDEEKEEKERLGGMVTRVNLPAKKGRERMNENMGFAYVDLLTPELQTASLLLSERPLLARRLLIKLGTDHAPSTETRTPKPASIPAQVKSLVEKGKSVNAESATLFMGNLGFDVKEEEVRDLVEGNAGRFGETTLTAKGKEGAVGGKRKRKEDDESSGSEGSESDEDDEEVKPIEADQEQEIEGPKHAMSRGGQKSGLKKVRLGQFEDTGRCKGFAFLDFKTPELATFALANPANHFLKGRKLVLQYASQAATERSGGVGSRPPKNGVEVGPANKRARANGAEEGEKPEKKPLDYTRPSSLTRAPPERDAAKKERDPGDMRGKKWELKGRPRPGAALAMAKRENVAIVEGAGGKKIVFD